MHSTADAARLAASRERCERARRTAAEAVARAIRARSEAIETRLQAAHARALRARSSSLRLELIASLSTPPGALLYGPPAPPPSTRLPAPPDDPAAAVHLTALAAFVHSRLDEEAASADLFHETGCRSARAPGLPGAAHCACPIANRLLRDIAIRRSIARISEATIRRADHAAPEWPRNEINALQDLQALAAAYELHGMWREEWRP
ncbi:DUF6221 family protein [Streptomyces sp. NPDC059900]|uniref:DUF6221 family protein n=1 Tax=Streptomyces sp. NPDC059900 TaxID=3155816 RepID=UPI003424F2EA